MEHQSNSQKLQQCLVKLAHSIYPASRNIHGLLLTCRHINSLATRFSSFFNNVSEVNDLYFINPRERQSKPASCLANTSSPCSIIIQHHEPKDRWPSLSNLLRHTSIPVLHQFSDNLYKSDWLSQIVCHLQPCVSDHVKVWGWGIRSCFFDCYELS